MTPQDGLKRVDGIGIREHEDGLQEICPGFQPVYDCNGGDQDDE